MQKQLGDWGEQKAVMLLKQAGYEIIAQNFHSRFGEIDIIAKQADHLTFIEVKARSKTGYGRANEVISKNKIQKIIKTAQYFLAEHSSFSQFSCQFDVICIDFYDVVAKRVQQDFSKLVYDLQWIDNAFTLDDELFNLE
nr:YraN family protein [Acinetobacter sp. Marseille-Q1620]